MTTASARVSRWSRAFVAASACWLVCWQVAAVFGATRAAAVTLGLYGFVFHTVFGKAYSLVPSYFDRELAASRVPAVHLPLAVAGTACLAAGRGGLGPPVVETAGAVLWTVGVAVFLGTLAWTVRDNLTGAETGTGDHQSDRQRVDRLANAAVPVVGAYLALGSYETLAATLALPSLVGYRPGVSHLLAAGAAALLVFAVGFRLLPRFLVTHPPAPLVPVVLLGGALGPLFLAVGVPNGPLLVVGATLEGVAVLGFTGSYWWLFATSSRDRVGFYGVLAGTAAGVAGVAVALWLVHSGPTAPVVGTHYRLLLLGFLGLTIVGVAFQFYPPTVGRFPGSGDRLAGAVLAALAGGLALEGVGLLGSAARLAVAGRLVALAGAAGYAYLLLGLFVQRARE